MMLRRDPRRSVALGRGVAGLSRFIDGSRIHLCSIISERVLPLARPCSDADFGDEFRSRRLEHPIIRPVRILDESMAARLSKGCSVGNRVGGHV